MELLERYLASVQSELSSGNKDDIIRELRGNLLDEIDTIKANNNGLVSAAQISELLKNQGHPVEVAQNYAPSSPLVASADMPLYKTILIHGATLIFVVALLQALGNLIDADTINPLRFLLQALGAFLDNIGLALIIITVAFYYLGKEGYLHKWRFKNWSPERLAKNPSAKLKLSNQVTDLSTAAFLLLILWTPLWMSNEAQQDLLFSLAYDKEYWRYILSALCISSVIFTLHRLTQQSWTTSTLIIYIFDHALFAIAFLVMSYDSNLIVFIAEQAINTEASEKWQWVWGYVETTFNSILLISGLVSAGTAVYYAWLLSKLKR
ncbi:hypothetical protein AADZ86_01295 [Colwelliaceae bacterium BS250]